MDSALDRLNSFLREPVETEHLEFKRDLTDRAELFRQCSALANEGGGVLVIGVADHPVPRPVVGTELSRNKIGVLMQSILDALRHRVEIHEIPHPDGRVVLVDVPPRPRGAVVEYQGVAFMRVADALRPMPDQRRRDIWREGEPDFSGEACGGASWEDLDPLAIEVFRRRWTDTSQRRAARPEVSDEQVLTDAGVVREGCLTRAAVLLFGRPAALDRLMPNAEIIYEFRSREEDIRSSQRSNLRAGFLLIHDELWRLIDLRNDRHDLIQGFFNTPIPSFNEEVVREAVLNAFCHRDYRLGGSIMVRATPQSICVVSPGGLPEGITLDNILTQNHPRNRCLAEALERCGLIERSGQGIDTMFRVSLMEGKAAPDFTGTDEHWVSVRLRGDVQHPEFVRILNEIGGETLASFTVEDLQVLETIFRGEHVGDRLRPRVQALRDRGIIETTGRGRGARHVLARRLYAAVNRTGAHTRAKGLDDGHAKALLLQHLAAAGADGAPMPELQQVLPSFSLRMIRRLIMVLRQEGQIAKLGDKRGARYIACALKAAKGE